ncbi:MAG: hypothetical protein HC875_05065 [Anaerolineales bacterium]|nr:hypothetical protein [Anaerolineales bacterium]
MVEDLQRQVIERTSDLETALRGLKAEIETRQQLENDLRQGHDLLSIHLADQSHKLTGLYNLMLMAGQTLESGTLQKQALDKIRAILNCEATCFYQVEQDFLHLEAQQGLSEAVETGLHNLPLDWLAFGFDVRADINTADSPDLPEAIARAGFGACLFKWVSLPDHQPGMLGALWTAPRHFAVEDIALFGALADGLGVILENSHLRTVVAENAVVTERRRLARDLHDSVAQSLHSLVLSAETAAHLQQAQPERLEKVLGHVVESARQALKEMRLLVYELRLASPEEIGLVEALQHRLDTVERRAGVEAQLMVETDASWPKIWEAELYPIAVESLNNALKYACATRVTVWLAGSFDHFKMEIADNGRGLDLGDKNGRGKGLGLCGMAERAQRLGGQIEVHSAPDQGTRVTFRRNTP